MDIIKKIKEMIAGQTKKKLMENTAIVIIIGVVLIIAGSTIFSGGKSNVRGNEQVKAGNVADPSKSAVTAWDDTEERLRQIIGQIQGVGKVDVMITYSATRENVPAYDVKRNQSSTEEKDSEGGTRSMSEEEYENELVYEDTVTGGKAPVILKKLEPEVKGVLVVAEGADSVEVREHIYSAVTIVLDVPVHRVQVAQRKK